MAPLVDERTLTELLTRLSEGEISVEDAVESLRSLPYEQVEGVKVDHHRELRTGQVEAVYGPGKTPAEVRAAVEALVARATGAVFVTRATEEQFRAVQDAAPDAEYDRRSGLVVAKRAEDPVGSVAVVAAGTSDAPVAGEAAGAAAALGMEVDLIGDVGVAGLHRVAAIREELHTADVVIVVAGMEGALASVVGGMAACPVIACPTSVGYGASFGGLAALLSMLSSCTPGVVCVDIDDGVGAGYSAALIARRIAS
jgi:pyridinium-3,5-biscarboxylic acid mononucleotide synthase